jgi:hypothetical protein
MLPGAARCEHWSKVTEAAASMVPVVQRRGADCREMETMA